MPERSRRAARAGGRISVLAAALLGVVLATAGPAAAHTLDEAVRAGDGCGWSSGGYINQDSGAATTNSGTRLGTVYLLWSGTYQENCVVTLKTHSSVHGVATWTESYLYMHPSTGFHRDGDYYSHYAAAEGPTRGVCVSYQGEIRNPSGQIARSPIVSPGWCG
ncbi:hypothetical protein ACFO4E_11220 [Nocardiopsis mangrovi]|uniref:Spore-associated protein A n=1 Tax=Nocardiopsis mangrovi TaxID=1179818 RepID=A0ABV9DYM2_9ACTN